MNQKFMVFDIESVGLHGEGFAVAYVVVNQDGYVLEENCFSCDPSVCNGTDENRKWINENIPSIALTNKTPTGVRLNFWDAWQKWKEAGALLLSDCGWPVETRFLCAAVDDMPQEREWTGPYPLLDLGSILFTKCLNPLELNIRLPEELPEHHPLMDARQSARILVSTLFGINNLTWNYSAEPSSNP